MSEYRPGYCNIGPEQRRRRYLLAGVGFLVAVGYLVVVVARGWPALLAIGVFAPLAVALEWFVQARFGFCVRFALTGKYDMTGSGGGVGEVRNAAYRQQDRYQAARITTIALLGATVLTAGAFGVVAILT